MIHMDISQAIQKKIRHTRLVVFDVDGVLTDGRLFYTDSGESLKAFHVRDGVGLKLLSDMGIAVAIVTAKDSAMVAKRVSELGIQHYFPGTKNKKETVTVLAKHLAIELEDVVFIGDDMVDVPAMSIVGASFCPNDAYSYVQQLVDEVLPVSGGQGVARYVCDLVLTAQGKYDQAYNLTMDAAFERKRQ
jgi:3-deoxy-D-manno-octulosonate 8-phosphate phosphatase (KDO 8-P phosphatase)